MEVMINLNLLQAVFESNMLVMEHLREQEYRGKLTPEEMMLKDAISAIMSPHVAEARRFVSSIEVLMTAPEGEEN